MIQSLSFETSLSVQLLNTGTSFSFTRTMPAWSSLIVTLLVSSRSLFAHCEFTKGTSIRAHTGAHPTPLSQPAEKAYYL